MNPITFVGVQNISGDVKKLQHDGNVYVFEKDEIRVLDAATVQFLTTRQVHVSDGKVLKIRALFKTIPLAEALKHVKEPENASIAAAKKKAEDDEKAEAALTARIIKRLEADGWKAPPAKPKTLVP